VSPRASPQRRSTISLAALLALFVIGLLGGCGGGADTSTESETPPGASETAPSAAAPKQGTSPQKSEHKPQSSGGGEGESKPNAGSPSEGSEDEGGEGQAESESGSANPVRSLQTFGSSAEGEPEAEVLAAFRGYLKDVATGNFAGICHTLTDANLQQLKEYVAKAGKEDSCPALLAELLASQAQPARDAAAGEIGQVRLKGTDAIVLFTPRGGKPSWFTMTKEDGRWRVISLTAGTPLDPLR
jgi:hypothetical protein